VERVVRTYIHNGERIAVMESHDSPQPEEAVAHHRVWVPHDVNVFEIAIVLDEDLNHMTVELESDGSVRKLSKSDTHDVDPTHLLDLEDLW
jgi:hypothetical protein